MEKVNRLKELIAENFGCEIEDVKPETNLVEDLEVDSLDIVELTMAIEEEFGVSIPDSDLENIRTVQDIINII